MLETAPKKILSFAFACLLTGSASAETYEYESSWSGDGIWSGPDFWARPLFAWKRDKESMVVEVGNGRFMYFLPWQKEADYTKLELEVTAKPSISEANNKGLNWFGFSVGNKNNTDKDPRKVLVGNNSSLEIGINAKGQLIIGKKASEKALKNIENVRLKLELDGNTATLTASSKGQTISHTAKTPPKSVNGHISLAAIGAKQQPGQVTNTVAFSDFTLKADGENAKNPSEAEQKELTFGPIGWTQYSLTNNQLRLSAQCLPIDGTVTLEAEMSEGKMESVQTQKIDSLSRTAIFSVSDWPSDRDIPYRVTTEWKGKTYEWAGIVRKEPEKGSLLNVAAFSCDKGYMFPNGLIASNVKKQNPDLLFFAGDQLYEGTGGFYDELVRTPLDRSMLDYLRKWYQFGWSWREVLKDRPSIIVLDDHDVFQGNIWGHGAIINTIDPAVYETGGYTQSAEWVNAIQRMQAGHLPESKAETNPSGIENYYTSFEYAGIPFAVLEDRKFKTGPKRELKEGERVEMLGEKQEAFVKEWSEKTKDAPVRLVLSQTIFAQVNTHGGPKLKEVTWKDTDTNGWVKESRDRALRPLMNNPNTLMLCGDQHYGIFLRHGIDTFGDGPYALMMTGTANWWPRAHWPKGPEADPESHKGDYTDPHGNKVTVYAAANPNPGTTIDIKLSDPEQTAHDKGSGHGVISLNPKEKKVTLNMYRIKFDADKPSKEDQFAGFPQTWVLE